VISTRGKDRPQALFIHESLYPKLISLASEVICGVAGSFFAFSGAIVRLINNGIARGSMKKPLIAQRLFIISLFYL
jgi:hypothetical protein